MKSLFFAEWISTPRIRRDLRARHGSSTTYGRACIQTARRGSESGIPRPGRGPVWAVTKCACFGSWSTGLEKGGLKKGASLIIEGLINQW